MSAVPKALPPFVGVRSALRMPFVPFREMRNPCDNVIIVPHMQITPGDSHLYNRAITSGGGVLAGLQSLFVCWLSKVKSTS
jgi:hypothetical protein